MPPYPDNLIKDGYSVFRILTSSYMISVLKYNRRKKKHIIEDCAMTLSEKSKWIYVDFFKMPPSKNKNT